MDTPKGDSQQGRRENRHSQREDLHSKKTINTLERELTMIFGLKALANKDTLLPTQMFPRLPARATFVADTNFVSGTYTKNVSDFVQKHFVSATNVSQFT